MADADLQEFKRGLRMAPPPHQAAYAEELRLARLALARGNEANDVAALPLGAMARFEEPMEQMAKSAGVACGKGCSWCCRGLKVDISAPEAVVIAEFMRYQLKDESFEAEQKRISEAADHARSMTADQRWIERTPCVFLSHDGSCAVHAVRPFACRAHNSMNAQACEIAAADDTGTAGVPIVAMLQATYSVPRFAIIEACEEAGLDTRAFELANAVKVALEPGSATRWRAGDRLFDAAVIPSDEEDRIQAERDLAARGLFPPRSLIRKPLGSSQADKNARKRARKAERSARKKGRGK